MSLINDALKRARRSQQQNPPPHPSSLRPFEPALSGGGNWLVPVVIILLFAVSGIFVGVSLSKRALPVAAAAKVKPIAAPLPAVTHLPSPGTNTVVVVPVRPEPRLQGILLAATRPCAIVDGKTVFVGDQVDGLRVAAISENSVTLQSGTETNVLSLSPR